MAEIEKLRFHVVYGIEKLPDGTFHVWQYSAGVSLQSFWDMLHVTVIRNWVDLERYEAHWIVSDLSKSLEGGFQPAKYRKGGLSIDK